MSYECFHFKLLKTINIKTLGNGQLTRNPHQKDRKVIMEKKTEKRKRNTSGEVVSLVHLSLLIAYKTGVSMLVNKNSQKNNQFEITLGNPSK